MRDPLRSLHGTLVEIREDARRLSDKGYAATATNRGLHALIGYRIARLLMSWRVPVIPLLATRAIQILYAIDLDPRSRIGPGCRILHGVGVVIAKDATIGRNCTLYHGVTLGVSLGLLAGVPTLGNDCTVGAGAIILGPVTIGPNVLIGANAVVTRDVPPNSTAVGNPGRILVHEATP